MTAAPPAYRHCLSINRLTLFLNLGVTAQERAKPQRVEMDLRFYFPDDSYAVDCGEDDYLCYGGISEKIHTFCTGREFTLIELLAQDIYALTRAQIKESVKMVVSICKCAITLPYVEGGTSFSYTDLPPGAWVIPL